MATVEREPAAASAAGIEVSNPATGQVIRTVPIASPDDVREIVARARAAQPAWEALGFEGRGRILRRAQKWVVDNSDKIVETIVSETGKTREDAQFAEVAYAAAAFGFWARHAPSYLADEKVRSGNPFVAGRKLVVRYAPLGVVGIIGPWNYPLTNSFGDCIPALAAGNAVVLKPSEVTPLTSLLMADAMRECGLPDGVYQVATGLAETGQALIDEVDMVMFTGSTATGKKVMERAARTLTPVSLELGGKDPMIVLADADLERAANAATYYSMQNAGQTCISIERVYVEAPVYDEFVARVARKVGELRQGPPGPVGSVDVGAVTFPPQLEIVQRHVDAAREAGATVLAGGRAGADVHGRFYEPTVLVDVDHSMACMTEETFGPTLPIMRVADAEEAVRLANDSSYGLAASVWTKDTARGEQLARRIEAGAVCVNDAQVNYLALELPMGGWKASGLGSRHGADGIRKYARRQSLLVTRLAPRRDLHMFPYRARTTRLLGRVVKLLYGRGRRD
jgi:acyl-CoA reductase-like NAD-dependent aldehyde dehydrogenase